MPSDIGYPIPPVGQRPQIVNRLDIEESKELIRAKDDEGLKRAGIEQSSVKAVVETREVLDDRFPTEGQVERFRGNTEGRELQDVPPSLPISRLPNKVQAFNPLNARSSAVSSLSMAESAATGVTPPTLSVNIGQGGTQTNQRLGSERPSSDLSSRYPSINGSGEIAARFDAIEDRIRQRALDEFEAMRPGGPESERVSLENAQAEELNQEISREEQVRDGRQEELIVTQRQQQNRTTESQQTERNREQNSVEEQNNEQFVVERNQSEVITPNTSQAPVVSAPGVATNSRGEPVNSEEQREVQRLDRREQELRSQNQAGARIDANRGRARAQLISTVGQNSSRFAASGDVSTERSQSSTAEATVSGQSAIPGASSNPLTSPRFDRSITGNTNLQEVNTRAEVRELQEFDKESVIEDQLSGEIATEKVSNEQASEVEVRENIDHFAGAQAVSPSIAATPKAAGTEQQSSESVEGTYPISTPESTSRPVTAPAKKLAIQEQSPPPASPRSESTTSKYDQAVEQALARD